MTEQRSQPDSFVHERAASDLYRRQIGDLLEDLPSLLPAWESPGSGLPKHLLVYGPAYSGKTELLVQACAQVPNSVLLLPSQGRIAGVRARLQKAVYQRYAKQAVSIAEVPPVMTLAGFVFSLVNKRRRALQQTPVRLLPEVEFLAWIRENLQAGDWPEYLHLALQTTQFADEVLETMNRVRLVGLSFKQVDEILAREGLDEQLRMVLGAVRKQLFLAKEAQDLRRKQSLEKEWAIDTAALFDYFLSLSTDQLAADLPALVAVDDLQDISEQSIAVLERMAACGSSIVAVSHPDVCVGSFRCALSSSLSLLSGSLLKNTKSNTANIIHLDFPNSHKENAHKEKDSGLPKDSGGNFLAGVHAAIIQRIEVDGGSLSRQPVEQLPDIVGFGWQHRDRPVQLVAGSSLEDHFQRMAAALEQEHIYNDVSWSNMAIIVRRERDVMRMGAALRAKNIPYRSQSRMVMLKSGRVSGVLLRAGQAICSGQPPSEDLLVELLVSRLGSVAPWQLRQIRVALNSLQNAANVGDADKDKTQVSLASLCQQIANMKTAGEVSKSFAQIDKETACRLFQVSKTWQNAVKSWKLDPGSVRTLLWTLWHGLVDDRQWQSRALDWSQPTAVTEAENEDLDQVMDLFKSAEWWEQRNPGAKIQEFFLLHLDSELPTNTIAKHGIQQPGIAVLTPAQAAGQSWDVVGVLSLVDGVWPNMKQAEGLLGLSTLQLRELRQGENKTVSYRALAQENWYNEYRLFASASSRARRKLFLGTCVGEENPSVFLENLATDLHWDFSELAHGALESKYLPGSVNTMVGRLRAVLEQKSQDFDVKTAILGLAHLARNGVPGAHPDSWLDNRPCSSQPWQPGIILKKTSLPKDLDPEKTFVVNASGLARFLNNPMDSTLDSWGLNDESQDTVAANIGIVVHRVAQELGEVFWPMPKGKVSFSLPIETKDVSHSQISQMAQEIFQRESVALQGQDAESTHSLQVAQRAVDNLVNHLCIREYQQPSLYEMKFSHSIDVPFNNSIYHVFYRGIIDRVMFWLDENDEKRITVIDYKVASSSSYPKKSVESNMQLLLYQAAIAAKYPQVRVDAALVMLKNNLEVNLQPSLKQNEVIEVYNPFSAEHCQLLLDAQGWLQAKKPSEALAITGETAKMRMEEYLSNRLKLTVGVFLQGEVAHILNDYRDKYFLKMLKRTTDEQE